MLFLVFDINEATSKEIQFEGIARHKPFKSKHEIVVFGVW